MSEWYQRIRLFAVFLWIDQRIDNALNALARAFNVRRAGFEDLQALEDEEVLHITYRHWWKLLVNITLPLGLTLLLGGLAIYRSLGGQFIGLDIAWGPELDLINRLLLGISGAALLFWLVGRFVAGLRGWGWPLLGLALLALGLFSFRYFAGGRIFYIDPYTPQSLDELNIALLLLMLLNLALTGYAFVNWANDYIILTNCRVVVNDEVVIIPRLIERRTQDQLAVEEIQNVLSRTNTYFQHWFNFGTITIQSASVGRQLVFNAARDPRAMQGMIDREVRRVRTSEADEQFDQMVEARIFGKPVEPTRRIVRTRVVHGPKFMRSLLEENPVIDGDTIIWHPHWLFLIRALIKPIAFWFSAMFVLIVALQLGLLPVALGLGLMVLLALGVLAWIAWEIEDYINDRYILTPTRVIDIEKKPFGPEGRLTAGLEAIQNVSFQTSFIGNLVGYGDVLITTAGSGQSFTFRKVPNPREVVATINNYLSAYKRDERERNLNDTLTILRHYHALQKRYNGSADTIPLGTPDA